MQESDPLQPFHCVIFAQPLRPLPFKAVAVGFVSGHRFSDAVALSPNPRLQALPVIAEEPTRAGTGLP